MNKLITYRIPEEYFFRLHHVRPRFKNDVEEVLLYVATSSSEMGRLPNEEFKKEIISSLRNDVKFIVGPYWELN